ncbi:hypothetical protein AX16_002047 [Volvariella volvacea WC 439]|nr:hypothetical protein AX16_002047 [Volvariella volvacea WC 439]
MSSDATMFSDDDRPLQSKSSKNSRSHAPNGRSGNDTIVAVDGASGDQSTSDNDEVPLSQTTRNGATSSRKRKKPAYAESSSDDDTPLASSPRRPQANGKRSAASNTTKKGNGRISRVKVESDDDNDASDDTPAAKPASANGASTNGKARKPPKKKAKEESESSDDDQPLTKKTAASRKRKVKEESEDEESDDDKPLNKATKARAKKVKQEDAEASKPTRKASGKAKKEESDDSTPPSKAKGKKKEKEKEEDEEGEEVYKWWEEGANGDGSAKWATLEHNGVFFPPPYEPLPSNVKMKYAGKDVDLPPAAEEVAGFYAAMLETDHAKDAVFNKNFFEDWKTVLKEHPPRGGVKITDFSKCDFRPMFEYFEAEKAKKKAMSAAEKKALKKEKEEMEAKYMYCLLDGRKEKVGNFRVEPPGLFRGRGEHPKKGALKFRVRPEDITINIGADAPIPVPNVSGKWKSVQHDNTVTWLANWTENVNGNHKYVFLAAGSSLKGQSDMSKFEKARELKKHVDRIRSNYVQDLKSKVMADRQRATAMYFIDKLALRAGNEKGEDEADTVGCCSLRCEHVTLEAPDFIIFDFLGKDSIRYYNKVQVEAQVFKNIRIFKENKNSDDNLFDRVTTSSLNKHLNSEMKGLTAKVFRTFNASITFQRLLDADNLEGSTLQEKLNAYNRANREVAILCNHQRSVPKGHDQSMEKMRYKLRGLKYDRMKLRHVLFGMDIKYKKNKKYSQDESDLDDEWIEVHEENLKAKEIEKAEKKFAKDNEKLQEEGKEQLKQSILKERLAAIEEEFARLEKERGTAKATLKRERPVEKIEEQIYKLEDKIKACKLQMVDRDAGKEVALGTSKINYLDPRITAAWCQTHDVPIEKLFSKTLTTKFPWAMDVDPDWKF